MVLKVDAENNLDRDMVINVEVVRKMETLNPIST